VPVLPAPDRRALLGPAFRPQPGEPWYELAPLGRCWYDTGAPPLAAHQVLDPARAVLTSAVTYPGGAVRITTFLHAHLPVLVERYAFAAPTTLRLFCAPGPWAPAPDDLDPFERVVATPGPVPVCRGWLGSDPVVQAMVVHPAPLRWGTEGNALWVEAQGAAIVRYFLICDGRDERLPGGDAEAMAMGLLDRLREEGGNRLYAGHVEAWQAHHAAGASLDIADEALARVYALTRYQLAAVQHPATGAIPVNNLRATWSSHVFWDAGVMHLLLLQLGHADRAGRACQFLERLRPQAATHARAYGAQGLKYEWEVTQGGLPAYGVHRHLVHQVHNNAMYSLMCWHQYTYTRDGAALRRFYPIVRGIAEFFLSGVVRPGPTLRPVTGIAELPTPVALDTATLAASIRALRVAAAAARALGRDGTFAARCEETADGLHRLCGSLINDGVLYASDRGDLSWGVLPACSVMALLAPDDPVVLRTARRFAGVNRNPSHGIVGHGAEGRGPREGFPWAAGWLAAIFAAAGAPQEAWQVLQPLREAVCIHGGLPEKVLDDGRWNMQYFTTAQAAVCLALHACVAHVVRGTLHICAPPWDAGAFRGLHLDGLAITGAWEGDRVSACVVRNTTDAEIAQPIRVNGGDRLVRLRPGAEVRIV